MPWSQAIHTRSSGPDDGLIHHSDRAIHSLAMNYTQRLAEANLVPSLGSVGDSWGNALVETFNGLYKGEVIWRQRSWPSVSAVEMATSVICRLCFDRPITRRDRRSITRA